MSTELYFEAQSLNAESVNRYLASRAHPPLSLAAVSRPDSSVEVRNGSFTQYIAGVNQTTVFNISQRNRLFSPGDGRSAVQYLYAVSIDTVQGDGDAERVRSSEPIAVEGAYYYLTPGRSVRDVYYGDVDRDGLNDILIRFSDGVGILYHARTVEHYEP
ncbi:MAG: hypothetical protein U1F57_09965 [bacterium]